LTARPLGFLKGGRAPARGFNKQGRRTVFILSRTEEPLKSIVCHAPIGAAWITFNNIHFLFPGNNSRL
jgi:hypothetical protein